MDSKVWKLGICVLVAVIILLLPPPAGFTPAAWQLFAMYLAAIFGLVLRPFDEAVILLGVIALGAGLRQYGRPVERLRQLERLACVLGLYDRRGFQRHRPRPAGGLVLIGKFGRTTLRLGYVAAVTDLAISPATPSNTARTGGIVYPIFQSIAIALDSKPGPTARRVGAYLTLTLYYISFTTGYTFLTAMAPNVLILSFAKSILKVQVDWILWAKAAIVPGLVTLFLIPWVVYKIFPPEIKKIDNETLGKKGLAELGPMSRTGKDPRHPVRSGHIGVGPGVGL